VDSGWNIPCILYFPQIDILKKANSRVDVNNTERLLYKEKMCLYYEFYLYLQMYMKRKDNKVIRIKNYAIELGEV
jgi:hypothetical protein